MQPTQLSIELQTLQLLNEKSNVTYSLVYNPRNSKWLVIESKRLADAEPGNYFVKAFAAGNTPGGALADALRFVLSNTRSPQRSPY